MYPGRLYLLMCVPHARKEIKWHRKQLLWHPVRSVEFQLFPNLRYEGKD